MSKVTTPQEFMRCNSEGQFLLAIQPGIPAIDALNMVSAILDTVCGLIRNGDSDEEHYLTDAVHNLVEVAKATINSVISGGWPESTEGGK